MKPLQNSGGYTRRQALQDLIRAENKNDDAVDNLTLIVDSLQPDEPLRDATHGFIDLLQAFGNGDTPGARGAYGQIDDRVKGGENRNEATQSYLSLIRSENKIEDASGNFAEVDHAVDRNRGRTESTDGFNAILRKTGNGNTPDARNAFATVVESLRQNDAIGDSVATFNTLLDRENKYEDAVEAYLVVDESLGDQESRTDATGNFVNLLNTLGNGNSPGVQGAYQDIDARVKDGGNRTALTESFIDNAKVVGRQNADGARESFGVVADSVREGEQLDSALEVFETLVRAENKLEDSIDGYQLIDSSLNEGESREAATSDYLEILSAVGSGNTPNALKTYTQIDGRVGRGESRHNATEAFLQGLSRENKFEDAVSNFDVISSAVDRGWSRDESTQHFHAMLSDFGSGNTPEATKHFKMVLNSLRKDEQLGDAVSLHSQILHAENKYEDSESGYRLVDSVVSEDVTREAATEYYLSLLSEYGSGDTPAAQEAFRKTHELILGS
jgi:tetratricopeptide (TPR) repeat protein